LRLNRSVWFDLLVNASIHKTLFHQSFVLFSRVANLFIEIDYFVSLQKHPLTQTLTLSRFDDFAISFPSNKTDVKRIIHSCEISISRYFDLQSFSRWAKACRILCFQKFFKLVKACQIQSYPNSFQLTTINTSNVPFELLNQKLKRKLFLFKHCMFSYSQKLLVDQEWSTDQLTLV